jgi:hypothetical protein
MKIEKAPLFSQKNVYFAFPYSYPFYTFYETHDTALSPSVAFVVLGSDRKRLSTRPTNWLRLSFSSSRAVGHGLLALEANKR